MKYIVLLALMINVLFGAKMYHQEWKEGQTFAAYLKANNVSDELLESISPEDKKFLLEMRNEYKYFELKNDSDVLLQALIPINIEMQIHIFKKRSGIGYGFDIIPIAYKEKEYLAKVVFHKNIYTDTYNTILQSRIAQQLDMVFRGDVDAKSLEKGDVLTFVYRQRTRVGVTFAAPEIEAVKVEHADKARFIFVDDNGLGFKEHAKKISYMVKGKKKVNYSRKVMVNSENSRFGMPLRHVRITSSFAYRRWHPILHRYRPHHGTDFGAKRGTPLLAVNAGKVIFSGRMGGYGNVVKIKHKGGYVSLYAHQSRRRVKKGDVVKKGQIIGYVGSTGRSTGPHLHFGLMKNGKWIDPMKVLEKKSIKTEIFKKFTRYVDTKIKKTKEVDVEKVSTHKGKLIRLIDMQLPSYVWETEALSVNIDDKEKYL